MKPVLRISYLAMSPADTPSLLAGVCPVRGKAGFAHGIPAGACPVRERSCFAHVIPAEVIPCVRRSFFAHGIPAGTCPVRERSCFAHGIPIEAVPCVGSPDLRTASLPEPVPFVRGPVLRTSFLPKPSRAWKALFCARHSRQSPSVRGKPGFAHGIPIEAVPCVGSQV